MGILEDFQARGQQDIHARLMGCKIPGWHLF
jgi:hypothetical protein